MPYNQGGKADFCASEVQKSCFFFLDLRTFCTLTINVSNISYFATHQTAKLGGCCATFFCDNLLKHRWSLVSIDFAYLTRLEVDDFCFSVDLK
jgi:hypothetical protein